MPPASPTTDAVARVPAELTHCMMRGSCARRVPLMRVHSLSCRAGHRAEAIGARTTYVCVHLLLKKHRSSPPFELWSGHKQSLHDISGRRRPESHLPSSRTRPTGACEASPMEGVSGTMAWLGHGPRWRRGDVYGHAYNKRVVSCR